MWLHTHLLTQAVMSHSALKISCTNEWSFPLIKWVLYSWCIHMKFVILRYWIFTKNTTYYFLSCTPMKILVGGRTKVILTKGIVITETCGWSLPVLTFISWTLSITPKQQFSRAPALKSVKKKLLQNLEFQKDYNLFMQTLMDRGFAKKVQEFQLDWLNG